MENTVISPEREKGIFFLKSPFAPPGLVVIVIYDRGLTPISANLLLVFFTGSPTSNIEQGIMNVEG